MTVHSAVRAGGAASAPRKRVLGRHVPAEGEGGLFSQTWFPLCLSSDVAPGRIIGAEFLGGRVIVFRDGDGVARVLSAYCPHLGADLSGGEICDDTVRCPFHHWRYDGRGVCVATGIGDAPPPAARLFAFPAMEKHGVVWVFNGEEPTFAVPEFAYPSEELETRIWVERSQWPIDPWVFMCNTADFQHLKALHGFRFEGSDPDADIEWTDHSMSYEFRARVGETDPIGFRIRVLGNSIFLQSSTLNGRWFGVIIATGLPRPSATVPFLIVAARRGDGDPAANAAFLDFLFDFECRVMREDLPIMERIHFRPGTLTRSDKALARFLDYLRSYPRTHPSADFIT